MVEGAAEAVGEGEEEEDPSQTTRKVLRYSC